VVFRVVGFGRLPFVLSLTLRDRLPSSFPQKSPENVTFVLRLDGVSRVLSTTL